ncbi:MAG: TonB-dependent receptor [Sphingomonas sp.]|uniref:TonB-dependent receptor domain-containing protein n=1 Tax=Sphingomonas sp. TaxID=28214 RepID=UPI0025CD1612|nr:TonB-dependent receptor [Sphingomonas sp.]MBX3563648.1 TonB-dependent receptor [Sphingomonas sp.]
MIAVVAAMLAPGLAGAQTAPAQTAPAQAAPAQPAQDKAIVVTGQRSEVTSAPDRLSFNIANDLQAQNGTVADALRAVPGVEVDLEGNVALRGDRGVTIMVDGRPSAMMSGESRATILQSMPASSIERVEVITNPSAAMSPEGSGGVINLVTKQARPGARSGTVRASIANRQSGTLNLNGVVSKPGLTVTGDIGYRHFRTEQGAEQDRSRFDALSNAFINSRQTSLQRNTVNFGNGRIGMDYDLDKVNRLSTEFSYRDGRFTSKRIDTFTSPSSAYVRDSSATMANSGGGGRLSWRRTLPGQDHEFVADVELQRGSFSRDVSAVTTPRIPAGAPGFERIRNAFDANNFNVKLDYKRPMGEGKSLNIGYQYNLDENGFDFTGARGTSFSTLVPVAALTNQFDYRQAIHALYGTFQFQAGKFNFQPGLRLEEVGNRIDQVTGGVHVSSDYFRVYPTLHAGYELSAKSKLRASYSRRIQRPGAQDLNPYILYVDPQNVRQGNPNLRPEVTDSFEFGWQLRSQGTFYSINAFYRDSSGGVTDVVTDLGGGVFLSSRANLATSKRAGVELLANGKLGKTLSYNASATYFWSRIDPRSAGIATPRSGATATVRANLNWQPTSKDYFQLNGFYGGRQLIAQGYREGMGVLNLGYRRKVNDKFSVLLTVQDLLETGKQEVFIQTPLIRDRFEQRGPGRIFLLSATYNFGNPGGRKQREPGFEFDSGAGAPPQ